MSAHLLTMSRPGEVRIEIHADGRRSWVQGPPCEAIDNAWCIADSARIAIEKDGELVPCELVEALRLLKLVEERLHATGGGS